MKKIFLITLIVLILAGCNQKHNNTVIDNTPTDEPPEEEKIPKYIDDNPITVGIYQDGKLITDISLPIKDDTDIGVFDVYFTNEENIGSTNTKSNFNKYYQNYQNIDNYKIGFNVYYQMPNKIVDVTIKGPQDMYGTDPIFNYLYDDIHHPDGAWYSHVEENEVNAETIYTSIKLYVGGQEDEIIAPIKLTAFTYDSDDDFDSNGHYRGNSKYEITINKK